MAVITVIEVLAVRRRLCDPARWDWSAAVALLSATVAKPEQQGQRRSGLEVPVMVATLIAMAMGSAANSERPSIRFSLRTAEAASWSAAIANL